MLYFVSSEELIMQNKLEVLITKVEISEDNEHLLFQTRNRKDCDCLWAQLAGQALDRTEGRKPILYNLPEDPPQELIIDVESDTEQLLLLLEYLEIELKDEAFLAEGTTDRIRKQISNSDKYQDNPTLFK